MDPLRSQLVELLKSKNAHVDLDGAIKGLPAKLRGVKPKDAAHTAWQLVEHIRISPARYSGVQPESETCFAAVAGWLLAENASPAERRGVEQKRPPDSLRSRGHAKTGGE